MIEITATAKKLDGPFEFGGDLEFKYEGIPIAAGKWKMEMNGSTAGVSGEMHVFTATGTEVASIPHNSYFELVAIIHGYAPAKAVLYSCLASLIMKTYAEAGRIYISAPPDFPPNPSLVNPSKEIKAVVLAMSTTDLKMSGESDVSLENILTEIRTLNG